LCLGIQGLSMEAPKSIVEATTRIDTSGGLAHERSILYNFRLSSNFTECADGCNTMDNNGSPTNKDKEV